MVRRFHTPRLFVGDISLDEVQSRHARDVLRLAENTTVEIFDDDGAVASAILLFDGDRQALVRVAQVDRPAGSAVRIIVASAVPKGERADWMVEKLSELGVATFIPLSAARSVVLPEGKGKFDRWVRIATESAKQSRRTGVMAIEKLAKVDALLAGRSKGYVLSTVANSSPIVDAIAGRTGEVLLAIGPEGGWTDQELAAFEAAGMAQVRLTRTVLRTETAAVAAATIAAVSLG